MAACSNRGPRLQLTLDDRTSKNEISSRTLIWNPSDILRGHLKISCMTGFEIIEAAIFLEGYTRNWVPDVVGNGIMRISMAEHRFLSQTMDVSPSAVHPVTIIAEDFRLVVPFHFIISTTVANSSPGSPLHCLKLPPSMELGRVHLDESGKRFAQPSISYQVRAVAEVVEQGEDSPKPAEISTTVVIMPHNEELPPTDTKDFPAEFKLQESRTIRSSLLGRRLGTMTVSVQEPRALIYGSSSTGASTMTLINLTVEAIGVEQECPSLQAMSFKILSLIRVKTFYSAQAFPQLPSQSLLTIHGGTQLRDEIIKIKTRDIPSVSWVYTYDNLPHAFTGNRTKSNPLLPRGKWAANINHPISVDSRILPTFCSSIVARLYSLILRLKISGIRKESIDLEVPLQVVHTSPSILRSEAMQDFQSTAGVVGEDSSSLELRRPSLASWFSDESLENEEVPPRYHK